MGGVWERIKRIQYGTKRISYYQIYQDFKQWQINDPRYQSIEEFYKQPVVLVLHDHRTWYRNRIEKMRNEQSAIALQTSVLEYVITSVVGNKSKLKEIEDFLPIKTPLNEDDPQVQMANYLGKETVNILMKLIHNNTIPPYVVKELRNNKLLWKGIELLRK